MIWIAIGFFGFACIVLPCAAATFLTRTFDIRAGEALNTLKQFSAEAGSDQRLLYPIDVIAGVRTNAIRGDYTPLEALGRMVAGTSLVVSQDAQTGALVVTRWLPPSTPIKASEPSEGRPVFQGAAPNWTGKEERPITLSPFEVNESSNVGYGAANTSTASRVAQAYIDVPQTINVFTSEFIKDYNIIDERALLQYVPNMELGFDIFNSRILRASQVNATYLDGLQQDFFGQAPPMEFYDRVEIVKGPSPAGFGVGEPGGIVNYVSKTPQGIARTDITFGIGDYQNYKFTCDSQGLATNNKSLSYRVNAFWDQGNYKVPVWFHKGAGVEMALKYDFDPKTTVQLIASYSETLTPADNNLSIIWENKTEYTVWRSLTGDSYPALPNTPKNPGNSVQDWAGGASLLPTNYNPNPGGWTGLDDRVFSLEAFIDHSFNDHIHARNSFEILNDSWDYRMSQISSLQYNPSGYAPGYYTDISRTFYGKTNHGIVDDIDILAEYNFSGADFKTLAGAVYSQHNDAFTSYQPAEVGQDGNPILQNIYAPSRIPMGDPVDKRLYTGDYTQRYFLGGWYAQEDVSLFNDRLALSASWREDYEDFYSRDFLQPGKSGYMGGWKNNRGVPRYSITLKPARWLSVYELYSVHHDPVQTTPKYFIVLGIPSAATYARYNNFSELEAYNPGGSLIESGMKGTFLDGRLTFSADFFHEINTGQVFGRVVEQDYDSSGKQVLQIGQNLISGVNAHGYEWEIFGQPSERLTLVLNYGQTKGHYEAFTDGQPHWWSQPPSLMGHAKYDFGDLHGKGFYVTFGGQYYWGYWQYEDPYTWFNAGQYTVDGGIGYRWDRGLQSLYFNMNNFTNQVVTVGNTDTVPWTVQPHEQAFFTYSLSF